VVVCLEQGANLHMAQLMPHCHSLSLASEKSRLVLPFWYRPTRVVPEKGPLNGCVCVCVCLPNDAEISGRWRLSKNNYTFVCNFAKWQQIYRIFRPRLCDAVCCYTCPTFRGLSFCVEHPGEPCETAGRIEIPLGSGAELGSPANDGVCVVVSVAGPYAGNEMGGVFCK